MIKYTGARSGHVCSVVVHVSDGEVIRRQGLKHICRHSPDGFQWGYGGSGPSDLALSLMVDYFERQGVVEAMREADGCYQDFKWDFIAKIFEAEWSITEEEIHQWREERESG